MYAALDTRAHRTRAPSLLSSLTELPRTLLEIQWLLGSAPCLGMQPRGDGHQVVVLPGFMAGDESTTVLRNYLRHLGYQPRGWGLGRNTGNPGQLLEGALPLIEALAEENDAPVSLVGQSLGGVYSREIARRLPGAVRQVITLGSPFATSTTDDTMRMVRLLFEAQSGLSVDEMRALLAPDNASTSPDVPVTAIYSKGDGVVAWQACMEAAEDHQTQNIRVPGSHCGMAFNPMIFEIIADRLAQSPDDWQHYRGNPLVRAFQVGTTTR